jgi:hypothetical protein
MVIAGFGNRASHRAIDAEATAHFHPDGAVMKTWPDSAPKAQLKPSLRYRARNSVRIGSALKARVNCFALVPPATT